MEFPPTDISVPKEKLAEFVNENDALYEILGQTTEHRAPKQTPIEQAEIIENTTENTTESTTENKKNVKAKKTDAEYKSDAETIIFLIDGLGSLLFPNAYRKKMFNSKEKEILRKFKIGELKILPELIKKKIDELEILKKNIPFKEYEIELLRNPLTAVLKKHNINSSAEVILITSIFAIMLPRMSVMFNKEII